MEGLRRHTVLLHTCLLVLALSANISHGYLSSTIINMDIRESGKVYVEVSGKFYGSTLMFALPYDAEVEMFSLNLKRYPGDEINRVCITRTGAKYFLLECDSQYPENVFSIKYTTSYYVWKYDNEINFLFSLPDEINHSSIEIRVMFPDGYRVEITGGSRFAVFPSTENIYSLGSRYVVVWDINENMQVEVFASLRSSKRNFGTLLIAFPLLLLISVLLGMRYIKKRSKEKYGFLLEDERKIVRFLEKKKGYVKQKDLVNHTGFSKAKVSRLLKNLEMRGLIEREERGRNCFVRIKEESKKVHS